MQLFFDRILHPEYLYGTDIIIYVAPQSHSFNQILFQRLSKALAGIANQSLNLNSYCIYHNNDDPHSDNDSCDHCTFSGYNLLILESSKKDYYFDPETGNRFSLEYMYWQELGVEEMLKGKLLKNAEIWRHRTQLQLHQSSAFLQ